MTANKLGTSITLILIPQADRRSISLRIPLALVFGICTALVGLLFAAGFYWTRLTAFAEGLQAENVVLQVVRLDNVQQRQELSKMTALAAAISKDLETLRSLEQTVRTLLGKVGPAAPGTATPYPSPSSQLSGGGIGGGGETDDEEDAGTSESSNGVGGPTPYVAKVRSQLSARSGSATARVRAGSTPESAPDLVQSFALLQAETTASAANLAQAARALETHIDYLAHRPTGYPVPGRITSRFGLRISPFGYGRQQHDGVDLAAEYGDPVLATAAGTVVFSGWRAGGYGLTVIIDHGYGYRTMYAHNDELLVQVGEPVQRGQRIADAGSTGDSTGPHVHYEVHLWGQPVDPSPYR